MAVLGLHFCARAFSSYGKWGPLFITVRGPLTIAASLVAEHKSRRAGSVIVAHGHSCSMACGIFPDQGSNPCPLYWQADSQPLRHQGSPAKAVLRGTFIAIQSDLKKQEKSQINNLILHLKQLEKEEQRTLKLAEGKKS